MKALVRWPLLIFILSFFGGCSSTAVEKQPEVAKYLFLAHTRYCDGKGKDELAPTIVQIDLSNFDMLLLGGDLLCSTTKDAIASSYARQHFKLDQPTTLLAPGNHDYADPVLLQHLTGRPTFYGYQKNKIVFLVLDTEKDQGSLVGNQLEMIKKTIDTLSNTNYLILLHHKLIWLEGNPELAGLDKTLSNVPICDHKPYCLFPNNFYEEVYPLLIKAIQKGCKVLCLGGDVGVKKREFSFQTKEGVTFLAAGVNDENPEGSLIFFEHKLQNDELGWRFLLPTHLKANADE